MKTFSTPFVSDEAPFNSTRPFTRLSRGGLFITDTGSLFDTLKLSTSAGLSTPFGSTALTSTTCLLSVSSEI